MEPFPLIAVTNLDQAKTLHIGKGEIVGFARPETKSVTYVATTNKINIEEYVDMSPRNWILKEQCKPLMVSENNEKSTSHPEKDKSYGKASKKCEKSTSPYQKDNLYGKTSEKCEKLPIQLEASDDYQSMSGQSDKWNNRCLNENVKPTQVDTEWNDINEVIESDFLISPGDIYPNCKVELQDVTITDETRESFEDICNKYEKAWQFKHTPFGLSQAPAYFQLLINKVLMECGGFAMGYLDDIIIFSKNKEDHLHHLEEIFSRLQHFGLKMKQEKCAFFKQHIQYLGHLIS